MGYTEDNKVALVGYDTSDRTFRALGQLEYRENLPRILAWASSEFGFPSESGALNVADAAVEGSLTEIETSVPISWMHPNGREFGGGVGHPDSQAICGYWSYDLATDTLVQPDLQGLCYPEYGDLFGIGYYREVTSTDRPLATLVRLDTQTGERRDLFTGEIEQILWVSEDERYAAIVSDETRVVEYLPGMHWQDRVRDEQGRNRVLHQPYLQFVELASGTVLARKPVSLETIALRDPQHTYMMYPRDYYVPSHSAHQIGAASFLLLHCEVESIYGYCGRDDSTVTRLDLTDTGPVETVLARNAAEILPDLSGALIWNETAGTYSPTVDIYDFASQRTVPFLKEPIPPGSNYNIRVDHQTKAVQVEVDLYVIAPHDGRFEYFLPDLTFASDGTRHLTKWLQPFPSIGADVCLVRPNRGANIRVQPDTASELFGTVEPGEMLRVAAKVEIGGVTWWQLRDGGYIHGSVVDTSGACTVLPGSDPAAVPPVSSAAPPISITCQLTVLIGVNVRSLPTTDGERVGSADVDTVLLADGYEFNAADQFRWWRLTTGEWLREDFVSEAPDCINVLPAGQSPQPARAPSAFTCKLNVLIGANLRAGPSADTERAGSAAEGFELTADGQVYNEADQFIWWRLTTGEWVREDFVSEEERCAELPEIVL
jgi:hypothetical protein